MVYNVSQAYGLTETYGPMSCHYDEFDGKRRQITTQHTFLSHSVVTEDLRVLNPSTLVEVPADGSTIGEVMIRGNIVMKGYLGSEKSTKESFDGGWFHTGDLAVYHGDGRVELKDRSKDIIISGGENISSIEVENILVSHPDIADAAVVAMEDERWGEVPCAFVVKRNTSLKEEEVISFSRSKMAGFKVPKHIRFCDALPKTITGKVQKHVLRDIVSKSKS